MLTNPAIAKMKGSRTINASMTKNRKRTKSSSIGKFEIRKFDDDVVGVGVGVGVGEIKGKYAIYMLCNPIKATLIGMSGKGFKVKG